VSRLMVIARADQISGDRLHGISLVVRLIYLVDPVDPS
jgi:hypothetical protein